jgi:phospholipid/cholesterol/gamma-HCH transport system substrate-binding protein
MTVPSPRRSQPRLLTYRRALGVLTLVVLAVFAYLATIAQNGLPWQSRYRISVLLPNADRLVPTDEVEIAGVAVGQVSKVTAVPSREGTPAYVKVELALDPSIGRLATDTKTRVLSASVLGATYLALQPGDGRQVVQPGGTLPAANSRPTVQLSDLFDVFNHPTAQHIRSTLAQVSSGLDGRGAALNDTISALSPMLGDLTTVSSTIAATPARLPGFLRSYEHFVSALAPVSRSLATAITGGDRTFATLATSRQQLGQTIDDAPPALAAATVALTRLTPPLDGLASLAINLGPGAKLAPTTLSKVNTTLVAGRGPLAGTPAFAAKLSSTLSALGAVTRLPSTDGTVRKLHDLLVTLPQVLDALQQGQVYCNTISNTLHNFAHAFYGWGIGRDGPPAVQFALTTAGATAEGLQQGAPSKNVDIDYLPTDDASECAAGNEPADGVTQHLGDPQNAGHAHPITTWSPTSAALAKRAGLVDLPAGDPR